MINIKGLTYQYPATDEPALNNLSLQVETGEFLAVVGPNGAGKSTLCYALSGFIPHFYGGELTGQIEVVGQDVHKAGSTELAGQVGLVFQDPFNQITGARFSVREEVAFGLENLGVPAEQMAGRIDRVLETMGLAELASRSPFELSGGQQQRLALASVMVMEPVLLILDEPTSQLDPLGTKEIFAALGALTDSADTTIVLVEHKLEWIGSFADRVIVLDHGQLVAGGQPREVLTSEAARAVGFGETRYTRVGRHARQQGVLGHKKPLPVSLDQAVEFFQ